MDKTFKFGAQAPNGGRSSNIKDNTSSIFKTRRQSMFMVTKTKKEEMSLYGRDTTVPTRDGELFMKTNTRRKLLKDSTENTGSTSTEHSTSDQECQ
jgi:hypothetical protein